MVQTTTMPLPSTHALGTVGQLSPLPPTRVATGEDAEADDWYDDDLWGELFEPTFTDDDGTASTEVSLPEHYLAHILVKTVTDLVRAGLPSVRTSLIADAHYLYLKDVELPEDSCFVQDLEWAGLAAPEGGGLLIQVEPDRWRPIDRVLIEAKTPVPHGIWMAAALHTDGLRQVAEAAMAEGEMGIAEEFLFNASKGGDQICTLMLAVIASRNGAFHSAESLLRGIPADEELPEADYELGWLLLVTGREDEAVQRLQKASDGGVGKALTLLGMYWTSVAEEDEGSRWLRKAAKAGDAPGMLLLSYDITQQGSPQTARVWYDRALSIEGTDAFVKGGDLLQATFPGYASILYEQGAEEGNPIAKARLAELPAYTERFERNLELFKGSGE